MANTKNYGLNGIGPDVQYGKGGGRLVYNTGTADFRFTSDGSTLVHVQVLDPVGSTDAATKSYVDSVASGLDPKASVRVATTANVTTYNASGGPAATGQFTTAPTTVDGITLAEGNRILVKSQSAPVQNGIYVVTATTSTWNRAADMDGTPADEVSAGNFVFVEQGTLNANSGWVLQGNGTLTLNTDALNWVLFSASSELLAGVGLVKSGNQLDLDFSELASVSVDVLTGTDEIIVQDGAAESRITVTNFLNTFDIPNAIGSNGLIVRTSADNYNSRSIAVNGAGNLAGLAISNGDGVSGNPTLGISITGLADMGEAVATGDTMILYNVSGTANVEVTVDQLKTFMNAGTSSTSITEGNTTVAIADPGTGTVTTTVDGTIVIVTAVGTTTFQNGNDVVLNTGSTLTVTDLAANRVVYTTTAGLLTSSTAYTFNGTTLALTGDMDITGSLDVDNINVNGNTISVTNTNGNLVLTPNGTGQINLVDGGGLEMFEFARVASAVNHVSFTNAATGNAPTFSTNVTGSDTNVDLGFILKGTGVLTVVAGSGNYEDNVTADDDIPNKKYVDDAVSGATPSGSVATISAAVNFTSATTQAIGTIPANATVLRVTLRVNTASDAATTTIVGDATNGTSSYMAAVENDPQQANTTFIAGTYVANGGSPVTANAIVATAGTVGAGVCIIEYRLA